MERIVMTWGLIPKDSLSETIYCGDSETSQAKELNFEIVGNSCKGVDNDFNYDFSVNELWLSNSNLYLAISTYISKYFGVSIGPALIYGGYSFVNDEPDKHSSSFEIIDSGASVFINNNQKYNGKIYMRYYFEEAGEIYDEKVCIYSYK
tara:strand:+ start:3599 stop:4045 length:447 start_codon:yes stop_codon:yes gene_type:complete